MSDFSNKERPFSELMRVPSRYVNILKNNHLDIVNLANNHTLDHGQSAFKQMIDVLNNNGIKSFGYSIDNSYQKECLIIIKNKINIEDFAIIFW